MAKLHCQDPSALVSHRVPARVGREIPCTSTCHSCLMSHLDRYQACHGAAMAVTNAWIEANWPIATRHSLYRRSSAHFCSFRCITNRLFAQPLCLSPCTGVAQEAVSLRCEQCLRLIPLFGHSLSSVWLIHVLILQSSSRCRLTKLN